MDMDTYSGVYNQTIKNYWEKYIENDQTIPESLPGMRPIILESWIRSKKLNIQQSSDKRPMLSPLVLKKVLQENAELISISHSYIANLSIFIKGTNFVIVLADRNGYVLDVLVEDSGIKTLIDSTALCIGAIRNEYTIGTSGIGTCLETGSPIQIFAEEHYVKQHHTYFCSCAPIHDPSKKIIGCLAMIGPCEMRHTHTFGMVCTAVDGIQKEIAMKKAYNKISLINNQLNSTIQSFASGVILLDSEKKIVQHNDRALSVLKLSDQKLRGRSVEEIIDLASLPEDIWDVSNTVNNYELTLITKQNNKIDITLTSIVVTDDEAKEKNVTLIIDEQKKVHQLVSKMSGFTAKFTFDSIIGNSVAVQNLKVIGQKAAQSTSNVLILGESGTGKELLAQSIHNASDRASGPFIPVNCGSIPKNLIESELFGYESGSFTGAKKDGYPGKFELADGGTLFLDEIGDMPLELQTSLLRVLQNHEITRIGGKYVKHIDVKVMAATNNDLLEAVKMKRFRNDLYYRLNVLSITIPPLRERMEDILPLAEHFIQRYNTSLHKNISYISDDVKSILCRYSWPGNVRELENIIERATNLIQSDVLTLNDLPIELITSLPQDVVFSATLESTASVNVGALSPEIQEYNKIIDILKREKGHVESTAKILDMPIRTLYRKIKKYNININQYRNWNL